MLRLRRVRTESAAVTPPTKHKKSAELSWNTGVSPVPTASIMAAIVNAPR